MKMKHYTLASCAITHAFQHNLRGEAGRRGVLEYVMTKDALAMQPFEFKYSEEDRVLVARYMEFPEYEIAGYLLPPCDDPDAPARRENPWSEDMIDAARRAAKAINGRKSAVERLKESGALFVVASGKIETVLFGHRATIDLDSGVLAIHDS